MKVTFNDIVCSMQWAIEHCGEDNPAEVMAHKLLGLVAQSHTENAEYHTRQVDQCRGLMEEIEARFKVEGGEEF